MTRSEAIRAPTGTPVAAVQEFPPKAELDTAPPSGAQSTRLPSEARATVPPPVVPAGSLFAWYQLAPLSLENAIRLSVLPLSRLPLRTTMLAFDSA